MIYRSLQFIKKYPSDFKVCKQCNAFNQITNDTCHYCGNDEFSEIKESLKTEIDYQIYRFNIDEKDFDTIKYRVD